MNLSRITRLIPAHDQFFRTSPGIVRLTKRIIPGDFMKRFACLIVLLCCSACKPSPPQESSRGPSGPPVTRVEQAGGSPAISKEYRFSGPYTHENLTVFLIHKPGVAKELVSYLTLEESLKDQVLLVTEKSDGAQVNRLEVENAGDQPVYLQAGDTVKGGKQDRTIGIDLILPPKSGKREIAAFCVEPGRWTARASQNEPAHADVFASTGKVFAPAPAPVATKEQKLAVKLAQSQEKVWEEGRKANVQLAAKSAPAASPEPTRPSDSFVLTTELPAVVKKTSEYTDPLSRILEGQEDVIGMAFAVNGDPSTVEIYSGPRLFLKLWPKLLKGAALEAIAKKQDKASTKQVTEEEIKALMTQASDGKTSKRDLAGDVSMTTVDGTRSAMFDTTLKGESVHRQVITK